MKRSITPLAVCLTIGFAIMATSFQASADRVVRFDRPNPAGGSTSGMTKHLSGGNGGGMTQRHVVRSDGEGNSRAVSGGAFHTPGGTSGARAGTTVQNADGSVQHKSGMTTSGTHGSASSTGSYTVDANGNVTQNRDTNMTNAATGNSYQGSTSYNSETGVTHSATCFDAGGNEISCPTR